MIGLLETLDDQLDVNDILPIWDILKVGLKPFLGFEVINYKGWIDRWTNVVKLEYECRLMNGIMDSSCKAKLKELLVCIIEQTFGPSWSY